MDKGKGKQVAGKGISSGKRKIGAADESAARKKRDRAVLQFFEDFADEIGYHGESSDDSDFSSDMEEEGNSTHQRDPEKAQNLPFVLPKEEEMDEEAFDRMMEDRYQQGSGLFECDFLAPSSKDPHVWKVKCTVGREKQFAFCLMHKFVELRSLGNKMQVISVFYLEHVEGFIFFEAHKEYDVIEACRGLSGIYPSRMMRVPRDEVSSLLSVQRKKNIAIKGIWARVKGGKYKGDLAQIVAVDDSKGRALIKLIPRIDLQALAQKYGGGVALQKSAVPDPRLISSSELEEFRPLIQLRHDRESGMKFEILDGLMLKDGYLYKKVFIYSLCCVGIRPTDQEILKFRPSDINESIDVEWLSDLYGERKKKRTVQNEKGVEKGEGSSSSSGSHFDLHDLVYFGRKDFGLIVSMEKDGHYKVLKEGLNGPDVVAVGLKDLKKGPLDTKFTAFDQHRKIISINDVVRVSEGPLKDRQGTVKQVYRGILFLYDENETENGGFFCCKSQICEKLKLFADACNEKGFGYGASSFEDFPSSPKSPLSPERQWEPRQNKDNPGDRDSRYSIGQTLRIRIGPLKGYLCRVLAIRYSDVTVKLDSQHKVLTVKADHLSEVRSKIATLSTGGDVGSSSFKPFDLLGSESGSSDWAVGLSTESNRGNGGGLSAGWSSWGSKPALSGRSVEGSSWDTKPASGGKSTEWRSWGSKPASGDMDPTTSQCNDSKDNATAIGSKECAENQNSSWVTAAANKATAGDGDHAGAWNSWVKATSEVGFGSKASDEWGKAVINTGDSVSSRDAWNSGSSWAKASEKHLEKGGPGDTWGKWNNSESANGGQDGDHHRNKKEASNWNNCKTVECSPMSVKDSDSLHKDGDSGWGKENGWYKQGSMANDGGAWEKLDGCPGKTERSSWWSKPNGGSNASKQGWGSSWEKQDGSSGWDKQDKGSSWGKQDGGLNANNRDEGSWDKADDRTASNKEVEDSWSKKVSGSNWGKQQGGSHWDRQDGASPADKNEGSWSKRGSDCDWKMQRGGNGWGKQDGGSGASNNDGGSSWDKQGGCSWDKKDTGSGWHKNEGTSGWDKQDGSIWSKQDGDSNCNKQDGRSSRSWSDGNFWMKNSDRGQQNFERPQSFDRGGRGLGGRRGGRRGGRGFGRGRFSERSQSFENSSQDFSAFNSSIKQESCHKKWSCSEENDKDSGATPWSKHNVDSPWKGRSSWNKQDGGSWSGSSWSKHDGDSSLKGGSSWNKQDGGSWSMGDGNSSWSKRGEGRSGGVSAWNKNDGDFAVFSSWGKKESGSSWGKGGGDDKPPQDGISSWSGQAEGSTLGKDSGSSWNEVDGNSPWSKQDGDDFAWGKKRAGSSWGKREIDSSRVREDGWPSWSKEAEGSRGPEEDGGSSWSAKGGSFYWNKQDGDGGTAWGRKDGGSSWAASDGSGNNRQDGSSSWSESGEGSTSAKQDGAPWSKQAFDSGHGLDGSRGGCRGGRNQFNRGRPNDQNGLSGWRQENEERNRNRSDDGGNTSWSGSTWKKGWGGNKNKSQKPETAGGREWSCWNQSTAKDEGWGSQPTGSTGVSGGWGSDPKKQIETRMSFWDQSAVNNEVKDSKWKGASGGWESHETGGTGSSGNWGGGWNLSKDAGGRSGSSGWSK